MPAHSFRSTVKLCVYGAAVRQDGKKHRLTLRNLSIKSTWSKAAGPFHLAQWRSVDEAGRPNTLSRFLR